MPVQSEAAANEARQGHAQQQAGRDVGADVADSLFAISRALTRIAKCLEENSGITEEN